MSDLTDTSTCVLALAQACQILVIDPLCVLEASGMDAMVARLLEVPAPRSLPEAVLAAGLLVQLPDRWGAALHRATCGGRQQACGFDPRRHPLHARIDSSAPERWQPGAVLLQWMQQLLTSLTAAHQMELAGHDDRRVDSDNRRPASRHDRLRLRLTEAIRRLRATDAKVEAIAYDLGWKSKKNFYRALRRAYGLTPTTIRLLSDEQLRWLLSPGSR